MRRYRVLLRLIQSIGKAGVVRLLTADYRDDIIC